MSIPAAVVSHHVIGAAETGSGKTLAFGLPILIGLLQSSDDDIRVEEGPEEKGSDGEEMETGCVAWVDDIPDAEFERMLSGPCLPVRTINTTPSVTKQPLRVLILTPTRELCIQICSHLRSAAVHTCIQVASLVGGLSVAKQTRVLSRHPEIVVSTPGRYVQLLEEGEKYCQQLSQLSYLVIDEVDRMLTEGHFSNISHIFDRIPCLSAAGRSIGPQVCIDYSTHIKCDSHSHISNLPLLHYYVIILTGEWRYIFGKNGRKLAIFGQIRLNFGSQRPFSGCTTVVLFHFLGWRNNCNICPSIRASRGAKKFLTVVLKRNMHMQKRIIRQEKTPISTVFHILMKDTLVSLYST